MVDFQDVMMVDIEEMDEVQAEINEAISFEEACERNTAQLRDLADALEESAFGEEVEELIEQLRMTADFNPVSETAEDLKVETMEWL